MRRFSQRMFDDHVDSIARRTYRGRVGEVGATRLYTSRDSDCLLGYRDHEDFDRATDLGPLDGALPREHVRRIEELRAHLDRRRATIDATDCRRRSVAFWLGQLADLPPLRLAAGGDGVHEEPVADAARGQHGFALERGTTEQLRGWAASRNVEPGDGLLAALFALVARYGGARDVCIETAPPAATSRRPLPIRVRLPDDVGFEGAVMRVREQCDLAASHAEGLDDEAGRQLGRRGRPFDIVFTEAGEKAVPASAAVALSWTYKERDGGIELVIDHDAAAFAPPLVARMLTHYR